MMKMDVGASIRGTGSDGTIMRGDIRLVANGGDTIEQQLVLVEMIRLSAHFQLHVGRPTVHAFVLVPMRRAGVQV